MGFELRAQGDASIQKARPHSAAANQALHGAGLRAERTHYRGKGLTGQLTGLWRYRVGNYRVVCEIVKTQLVIVAVDIGHRSDIYR